MNSQDTIPQDVRQFVLERIDSVPHLEALLLLWERSTEVWTLESLAHALYIDVPSAREIIRDLMRRGWITRESPSGPYFFDTRWDPDGTFMQRLAHTYRRELVRMATLIHSNTPSAVRDFAKAFEINKKE